VTYLPNYTTTPFENLIPLVSHTSTPISGVSLRMKTNLLTLCLLVNFLTHAEDHTLANANLSRTIAIVDGVLKTTRIDNKRNNTSAAPTKSPEFKLRFSKGTHRPETTFTLTAADFRVTKTNESQTALTFTLENAERKLTLELSYTLAAAEFYMHKQLTITSSDPITLERIDVEALELPDAYQPYTIRNITANAPGRWSPGLGQPLYTKTSGTFWGIEFPAADNTVKDNMLIAGYLYGRELQPNQPYKTYSAVCGVADDATFVADAFQEYIDSIRIRPLRLQVQYNTWFDTGGGVRKESFAKSVEKIHHELSEERGNKPLSMYVIDDGWQDTGADWSDKVWKVNAKFDPDFASSRDAASKAKSHMGLWLSPGCLFGATSQVKKLRAKGFEALDDWMSMAGPKYMQALEDRMTELAHQGVGFFKLDGVFGHLIQRNFELHGESYGIPTMPQLGTEGFKSADGRLNDPKYDELKIYYLSAGTERLIKLFHNVAQANPDIYLLISNGAYLSPWWLMHVDNVWMINAGDAAGGSSRTAELVYRDDRYYEIFREQNTQYPMSSIFNHEPKKTSSGETKDTFRKYLYMHLSRGTGFIELYIKPAALQPADWDVLSEGLHWAADIFPTFKHIRMHGGSPKTSAIYGYTGWTQTQGFISIHNPSDKSQTYSIQLDRTFGLLPNSGPFSISSPIDTSTKDLPLTCQYNDKLSFTLAPKEIRIINFDTKPKDWSILKALQTRSPDIAPPPAPKPIPIDGHAILGTWEYQSGGESYTREFTKEGICILRKGDSINWKKNVRADSPKSVLVEDSLHHTIQPDGTLKIEGRYVAKRRP